MKKLVSLIIGFGVYGCWLCFSPRHIARARDKLFASHDLTFLERQAVAFMLAVAPSDTRTASHYWASEAGNRFHSDKNHRLTLQSVTADDFYRRPLLDSFAAIAAKSLRPQASIIELGCGAGGNLLYLAERLAQRDFHLIGFDINAEIIESNQKHANNKVSFAVKDCFASDLDISGDVAIFTCAVLMYVQEQDIRSFLQQLLRNRSGKLLFGLTEPVLDPDASHSARHNNLASTHGYRRIFSQLRFKPLFESTVRESGKASQIYHAVFEYVG